MALEKPFFIWKNRWVITGRTTLLKIGTVFLSSWFHLALPAQTNQAVSFSRDVAPILANKCLTCHNSEKPKGGYDVQTVGAIFTPGKSKKSAVTAHEPEKSELFQRLITEDPDDRMPQDDQPLPQAQRDLIKQWIAEGASVEGKELTTALSALLPVHHPLPPQTYRVGTPVLTLEFVHPQKIITGGYHELLEWDISGGGSKRITNIAQSSANIRRIDTSGSLAVAGGNPGKLGEIRIISAVAPHETTPLFRHHEMLLALAVNHDFSAVAVGGSDHAIRIFNLADKRQLQWIQQHSDWVTSLDFSPDGKQLISGSRDRTARIYSVETGALEATYAGHGSAVLAVAFRPDGKHVYSAGKDKAIHLWRVEDGKKIREIGDGTGEVYSLLAQEKQLYAAGADKVVRQYDSNSGNLIRTYAGASDWIYCIRFSPGKDRIAAGTYDGSVFVWDVNDSSPQVRFNAYPR